MQRCAFGFVLLTFAMSCALSPAAEDESADFAEDAFKVEDATVSSRDKGSLSDAGLDWADAAEQVRAASPFAYDASADAQARGSVYSEPTDASLMPDGSTPSSSVAAADTSTPRSETVPVSSAPAPVVTPSQPSSLLPADSSVPAKPSTSIDAGASPVRPAPSAPPAVADAGQISPPVDAGSVTNQARCVAGRYSGAFRGQIVQPELGSIVLTGSVTLQLTLSMDGRTLDVASGVVEATDAVGTPIHADIDGTVDCTTNQVKGGTLRGNYGAQPSDSNAFAGSADGSYESTSPAKLHGTWNVPLTDATATGTYDATLQD